MTDYIEREALLDRVYTVKDKLKLDLDNLFEDGVRIGFENVEIEIENYPAADVRPVVRGKWVTPTVIGGRAFNIPHCSACDGVPCGVDEHTNFCPNCGADMRAEEGE